MLLSYAGLGVGQGATCGAAELRIEIGGGSKGYGETFSSRDDDQLGAMTESRKISHEGKTVFAVVRTGSIGSGCDGARIAIVLAIQLSARALFDLGH